MQSSKETKILNIICVILILLTGAARGLGSYFENYSYNCFILALYSVAAILWISQIQRRIIQPDVRKNLTLAALMIIFWIALRTLKYDFFGHGDSATRYAWYLYYLPQTFIPLLMFFSVLYVGRPYDRPISRRWKLLYIPAVLITAGILTNDIHQMAFRFPDGLTAWDYDRYIHGFVYFLDMTWIFLLFLAILVIVFVRCSVPEKRGKIWIPLLPLAIGIVFMVLFFFYPDSLLLDLYRVPEIVCFIYMAFMECLILAHLLPSNDSYGDFWNASSIGGGIMDENGVIRYRSRNSLPVAPEQIRQAQHETVLLQDGSIALNSHAVHGGFSYWTKDISDLKRLNRELIELGDVLTEENALLAAENKMAENRIRIEQQSRLYDSITKSVRPQLEKISNLLDTLPQDDAKFEQMMKYACILNVYVKRYSNLLLLLGDVPDYNTEKNRRSGRKWIGSGELKLAISESLEYVRLYGVKACGSYSGEMMLEGRRLLLTYELFEAVLETGIPGADAILVSLELSDVNLILRMELNRPGMSLPVDFMEKEIASLSGSLAIEEDEKTEYVSLILPTGGETV